MNVTELLRRVVSIPALSGREGARTHFMAGWLASQGLAPERVGNNLIVRAHWVDDSAPVLLLNSHLDTVEPSSGYTFDPFDPPASDTAVYGLGSNDAGGSVVSMTGAALHFNRVGGLPFNLLLVLSAEEEVSGAEGISLALTHAGRVDCAVIGEPTGMKAAIAERGLLVLDGVAAGVSGHAAHCEGGNAIYRALRDIDVLRNYRFARVSPVMGGVKITVTQINAGSQHNVVPDACRFVVDVRTTDCYTNQEIWHELQAAVKSTLTPRSLNKNSSATPAGHPLAERVWQLGIETYVSPTTSDWVRIGGIPAVKMGPGDSARSHTPDEYITVDELRQGVEGYIKFIEGLEI